MWLLACEEYASFTTWWESLGFTAFSLMLFSLSNFRHNGRAIANGAFRLDMAACYVLALGYFL